MGPEGRGSDGFKETPLCKNYIYIKDIPLNHRVGTDRKI